MGYCSELHAQIYIEPSSNSEYAKQMEQEYWETEKRRAAYFWEVQCQAWPIDMKEKQEIVKAKCKRAAQRMQEIAEARKQSVWDKAIPRNQKRLKKRLEQLLKDFPRAAVLQELKKMELC
jgi:hypothetical protein